MPRAVGWLHTCVHRCECLICMRVVHACVFRIDLKGWKHISNQVKKRTDKTLRQCIRFSWNFLEGTAAGYVWAEQVGGPWRPGQSGLVSRVVCLPLIFPNSPEVGSVWVLSTQ